MLIFAFLGGFIIGGTLGGMVIYAGIKEYRKQLGLAPDPFERQTIYTKEAIDEMNKLEVSRVLNEVSNWTKGRNITKEKLREFINQLKKNYVSQ